MRQMIRIDERYKAVILRLQPIMKSAIIAAEDTQDLSEGEEFRELCQTLYDISPNTFKEAAEEVESIGFRISDERKILLFSRRSIQKLLNEMEG